MSQQNRVAPDGSLHAVEARGLLMGNRGGRFHKPDKTLGDRRWVSRQWIACEICFKDRHRSIWGDSYTELFFLDEVTALAAGHRPCFECRRAEAKAFLAGRKVSEFDRQLHEERLRDKPSLSLGEGPRRGGEVPSSLPDGVMLESQGAFFALRNGNLLRWSHTGYVEAVPAAGEQTLRLLTPPTIVQILSHGYKPRWHPSALQWEAS